MKQTLLTFFFGATLALSAIGQSTATNFNCNDCDGGSHDLFAELNSGKVIVIAWVMPCSACLGPTQTAYSVVEGYATSNPGQVFLYVADDVANTNCSSIAGWCNSNNMPNAVPFSNSSVNMSDYGSAGMPKIVVLGGGFNHTVYFNQNNSAANNATAINNAVTQGLADATGINTAIATRQISLFPNPANEATTLSIFTSTTSKVTVEIVNALGQVVLVPFTGNIIAGENKITIATGVLSKGMYFVRIIEADRTTLQKLEITD
ncbi:MAG TPA: T9SS type A sorting domain-containing protein [Bacteroidia bacterium]|nr:T9SS type A sorting domain-containing protein [Bacteroidia bacterium]